MNLQNLLDIEERGRGRLSRVLSSDGMEHDRELLPSRRQIIRIQVSVCYGGIGAWLELATVKLEVGILQDGFMRPKVLHQFDHTTAVRMSPLQLDLKKKDYT